MKANYLCAVKKILTLILLAAVSLIPGNIKASNITINSNSSKEKKIEYTVSIPDFTSISANNAIQVVYKQGPSTGIAKITTTESGKKHLKVEVKHGTLELSYKNNNMFNNISINGPTIVTVQSPSLSKIALSSAAKIEINGQLNLSSSLQLDMSSASKASFTNLNCSLLKAEISSSATLSVNNFNGNLNLDLSSAAKAGFDKINCNSMSASTSSAAKLSVDKIVGTEIKSEASSGAYISLENIQSKNVAASASSGATITLSGKCNSLEIDSSSGGRVDTCSLSKTSKIESNASTPTRPSSKKEARKRTNKKSEKTRQQLGQGGNLRIP